jgi:hypothetical protein
MVTKDAVLPVEEKNFQILEIATSFLREKCCNFVCKGVKWHLVIHYEKVTFNR